MSEVISQILYDHDNDGENLSYVRSGKGGRLYSQSHRHGWTYTCTNVFDDRCLAAGRGGRVVPTTPPPPQHYIIQTYNIGPFL